MTTNYEPYFKVMKQVAAERGGKYSHGTTWGAIDSTRDGERVVVEAGFYTSDENTPYFVLETFEYETDSPGHIDGTWGTKTAELMRFVEKWV